MRSVIFFSFILLFGAFIWFYSSSSSQESSPQLDALYNAYLIAALERNTSTHSVIFSGENNDTLLSDKQAIHLNLGSEVSDINSQNTNNNSLSQKDILSFEKSDDNYSESLSGRFGTPQIPGYNAKLSGSSDSCNGGIFYDPCLVIGNPIPANGNMRFGINRSL